MVFGRVRPQSMCDSNMHCVIFRSDTAELAEQLNFSRKKQLPYMSKIYGAVFPFLFYKKEQLELLPIPILVRNSFVGNLLRKNLN